MSIPGSALPLLLASPAGAAAGYEIERSLRFNLADSAYLNRTPASAGNRKTWTWAGWVKRGSLNEVTLFTATTSTSSSSNLTRIQLRSTNNGYIYLLNVAGGTSDIVCITTAAFRDPSAWYHIVVSVDTTQASVTDGVRIWVNNARIDDLSSSTYTQNATTVVNNTNAHFIGSNYNISGTFFDGYLADVHFIDGAALDPTDFGEFDDNGVWQPIDASGLTYGTNGFHLPFSDSSSASALGTDTSGNGNDWTVNNITSNTTVYNSFLTNETTADSWRTSAETPSAAFDGSISTQARVNDVDEVILLDVSSFSFTGAFEVYTNFAQSAALNGTTYNISMAADAWTTISSDASTVNTVRFYVSGGRARVSAVRVNGSILINPDAQTDSLRDSPTNGDTANDTGAGGEVPGNYATLQPLDLGSINTLKNGNLQVTSTTGANWSNGKSCGTIGLTSGKWYWEHTQNSNQYTYTGVGNIKSGKLDNYAGQTANSYGWLSHTTTTYSAGPTTSNAPSMPAGGGTVMIALDLDNGKIWWGLDGTWVTSGASPNPATGTDPAYSGLDTTQTWFPLTGLYNSMDLTFNFGQRPFAYSAPSGFKALCTANLDTPTIEDGSTAMDVALYTGNSSTQTISGLGFSPDFVWTKRRSGAVDHFLFDAVRGSSNGNFYELRSNTTDAEGVPGTPSVGLTSLTSDGFTLGSDSSVNANTESFVAWTWDAGSSTVANTDGSISSSVRANPSVGFSIVSYTGVRPGAQTVGHGLNAAPGFAIFKIRNTTGSWAVYHSSLGPNSFIVLDSGAVAISPTSIYNNTAPTSSVFTVGEANTTNENGGDHIALCWAPVEGYSAFGSYTGNGSTDGPFVYTGFRPRWIMIKASNFNTDWAIIDTARDTYNAADSVLDANNANAESTSSNNYVDVLSNGFKLRTSTHPFNAGYTYIWASFAENPFRSARAR